MKILLALLSALPQIIKLIETIQKQQKLHAKNGKIKDDIEKINQAFESQDPEKLRSIFSSVVPDGMPDATERN